MCMNFGIDSITKWMENSLPLVYVILVWVVIYLFVEYLLTWLLRNQKQRRKNVLSRLHQCKEKYRKKEEIIASEKEAYEKTLNFFGKWDEALSNITKWEQWKQTIATIYTQNQMVEALRFEKHLNESEILELQKESSQISKEEKYVPFLNMVNFVVRISIFLIFLHTFLTVKDIQNSSGLLYSTVILTFFSTVTRKTAGIFLILAVIGYFVYVHFTGAACIFILGYWVIKGILFRIKQVAVMAGKK